MSRFAEDKRWDEASYAAGMIDHQLKIAQFETAVSLRCFSPAKVTVRKRRSSVEIRPKLPAIFVGKIRR
jgi:hypothetical protein